MHLGAGFPQHLENLTGAIPRSQQKGNLDEADRDTLGGRTNNRSDAKHALHAWVTARFTTHRLLKNFEKQEISQHMGEI